MPYMIVSDKEGTRKVSMKVTPFTHTGGIDWQTMQIAPGGFWRVDGRYFELMGIQKNRYKIKGHTVRFFNVFDIDKFEKVSRDEFLEVVDKLGLETVPVHMLNLPLVHDVEGLLKLAEGKSVLNSDTEREGLVIRSLDNSISFKAISNKFLLKSED